MLWFIDYIDLIIIEAELQKRGVCDRLPTLIYTFEWNPTVILMGNQNTTTKTILSGELYRPIIVDDATWSIEDKTVLVVTVYKNGRKEEWWPHVCVGEPEIDFTTLRPPAKHIRELEEGAQMTIHKMMLEQHEKRQQLQGGGGGLGGGFPPPPPPPGL